jgi:hypothetical protein
MEKLAAQAGLTTTPLPTRVQLIRRGPYRVLLNYQDTIFNAPPRAARGFVVGSRESTRRASRFGTSDVRSV